MTNITLFYQKARKIVISKGYISDIEWCESLNIKKTTRGQFFHEYVWCVLNAGMKEQVARKIYNRFKEKFDLSEIRHEGKREAIKKGMKQYKTWFTEVLASDNQIDYLESLPWIGPITKYHLARNIGIDCVKPDRHLMRLAEEFNFKTPLDLCIEIQNHVNERLGVIDIILWRYCNLKLIKSEKKSKIIQKQLV